MICLGFTANISSDSDVANYKQEIKRCTPYGMQSFSPPRQGTAFVIPFLLFCPPIRRKCHRLIPDNVASGKLEREYIARGSASPLCDSGRSSSWDSIMNAVLSSGFTQWKIFPTQRSKFSHWMRHLTSCSRHYVFTVNAPFTSKLHPPRIPIVYGMPLYEFSWILAKTNSRAWCKT